jgi:hypothetical protein
MDPFCVCLALGPAAVYLLLLGAINFSRRPFVVSGTRDAAALGLAVSGFLIVGPLALFFPDLPAAAAARVESLSPAFVAYPWLPRLLLCPLMLGLYVVGLLLILLLLRPRLIIYNISADQLRAILGDLVEQLDAEARWAGDSLALPSLGVQLHLDNVAAMRNVSLVASGPHQSDVGWRRLESALAAALERVEVARNPHGASLIGLGVLIVAALVVSIARDPQAVAQSLLDLFRL